MNCRKCGKKLEWKSTTTGKYVCINCGVKRMKRQMRYHELHWRNEEFVKFRATQPNCAECVRFGTLACESCIYKLKLRLFRSNYKEAANVRRAIRFTRAVKR